MIEFNKAEETRIISQRWILSCLLCLLCIAAAHVVSAQSLPAGKLIMKKEPPMYPLGGVPVSQWKGMLFRIFPTDSNSDYNFAPIERKYSGDTLEVMDVEPDSSTEAIFFSPKRQDFKVRFRDRRSNEVFIQSTRQSYDGRIGGIVPALDIDRARTRWVNKHIWVLPWSPYCSSGGTLFQTKPKVVPFERLRVLDVAASHDCARPVMIKTLNSKGDTDTYSCAISSTNGERGLLFQEGFGSDFMEQDPGTYFEVTRDSLPKIFGLSFGESMDATQRALLAQGLMLDTSKRIRIRDHSLDFQGNFNIPFPLRYATFQFTDSLRLYAIILALPDSADTSVVLGGLRRLYGGETRGASRMLQGVNLKGERNSRKSVSGMYYWNYNVPGAIPQTITFDFLFSSGSFTFGSVRFENENIKVKDQRSASER